MPHSPDEDRRERAAREFALLGQRLARGDGSDTVAQNLADLVVATVDGCEWSSILRCPDAGRPRTLAHNGGPAELADELQRATGVGPGPTVVFAAKHGASSERVVQLRVGTDPRWPQFTRAVQRVTPVRSILSVALDDAPEPAALNLYSSSPMGFPPQAVATAVWCAAGATALLLHARSSRKASTLGEALASSRQIGAAIGIIMATRQVTEDEAFRELSAASQNLNRKLRDLAGDVVLTGAIPSVDQAPRGTAPRPPRDDAGPAPGRVLVGGHRSPQPGRRDGLPGEPVPDPATGDGSSDAAASAPGTWQVQVSVDDLHATEVLLSNHFPVRLHAVGNRRPAGRLALAARDLGGVGLGRAEMALDVEADVAPLGTLMFVHQRAGLVGMPGSPVAEYGPGQVYLPVQPDQAYRVVNRGVTNDLVTLDQQVLHDMAGVTPDEPPIRFTSAAPVDPRAAERFVTTYQQLGLLSDTELTPVVQGLAARLMVATVLSVFPNTFGAASDSRADSSDAHPEALRRALDFLETHAGEDIGVADLARAARVSTRSVQLAFRRHLDTTPGAHLRAVRLQRARQDLLAAETAAGGVAAIAARWGFANPDRFRTEYRRRFGETPEQTLER